LLVMRGVFYQRLEAIKMLMLAEPDWRPQ
jgi:hypothetical protein